MAGRNWHRALRTFDPYWRAAGRGDGPRKRGRRIPVAPACPQVEEEILFFLAMRVIGIALLVQLTLLAVV